MNAKQIQDKMYRGMSANQKLNILGDMFEFVRDGKRYHSAKVEIAERTLSMEIYLYNRLIKNI